MRVVCENCGATYKIPETKLVKELNKATCRKCGFRMMIRRPADGSAAPTALPPLKKGADKADEAATQVTSNPLGRQDNERSVIDAAPSTDASAASEWDDDAPTQVQADTFPTPVSHTQPTVRLNPSGRAPGDMLLALIGTFSAAAGPMLLATNTADVSTQRMLGLLLGLWGALICLFLLVTGNLWRQKGNMPISVALATVLSLGATAFVELAMYGQAAPAEAPIANTAPPPTAGTTADQAPKAVHAPEADSGANEDGSAAVEPQQAPEPEQVPEPPTAPAAPPPVKAAAPDAPEQARTTPPAPDETLDEPDIDEVASSRAAAEERRRQEMEAAAARSRSARQSKKPKKVRRAKASVPASKVRPPATTGPPKMKSLPLTVVDTMIRSNLSIKRCFFTEQQASGALPSRVNVRFTVMPTGSVSSARVTTEKYKGGTLDSCLGRSFKAIGFPAFEGEPLSMTYPFIL